MARRQLLFSLSELAHQLLDLSVLFLDPLGLACDGLREHLAVFLKFTDHLLLLSIELLCSGRWQLL